MKIVIFLVILLCLKTGYCEPLKVGKINVAAIIFFHPLMKNYNPKYEGFIKENIKIPKKLVEVKDRSLKIKLEDQIQELKKELDEQNKEVQKLLNLESKELWDSSKKSENIIKKLIEDGTDPAKLYKLKLNSKKESEDIVKNSKKRMAPYNKKILDIRKKLVDLTNKYDENNETMTDEKAKSFLMSDDSYNVRMENIQLDVKNFTDEIIQEEQLAFAVNISFYTAIGKLNVKMSEIKRKSYGLNDKELEFEYSNPDYLKSLGINPAKFRNNNDYKDIYKFYYFRYPYLVDIIKDQIHIISKLTFSGNIDIEYEDITVDVMKKILNKYNSTEKEKVVILQLLEEMKQFIDNTGKIKKQ